MLFSYSNPLFVFTGGTPYEYLTPNITLMQGKSLSMLSCDSVIVDFVTIPSSPHLTGELTGVNDVTVLCDCREAITPFVLLI